MKCPHCDKEIETKESMDQKIIQFWKDNCANCSPQKCTECPKMQTYIEMQQKKANLE